MLSLTGFTFSKNKKKYFDRNDFTDHLCEGYQGAVYFDIVFYPITQ